ncbi:MAG: RNA helicase [Clostridia bacterium]|nr:MAG: RNA helicase [Clostridia bacterium]
MTTFSELGLRPELVQTVTKLGYAEPTPIQRGIIPLMLAGNDVLGQAQTGTGKTAAFALPILQKLNPHARHVQTLVLIPTRELAMQVARSFQQYGQDMPVSVLAVYGGQSYEPQIRSLRRGVDVVVGTPGRLLDLARRRVLDLSQITTLVLDEADEMLSMGFVEDIETILSETPADRQTTLFSATLPAPIRRLADGYMNAPQAVTIKHKQLTVAAIEQRYYLVNQRDKLAALTRLFEVAPITSALVFARTRIGTGELAAELTGRGFPAEALNGDMSQSAREQVLRRFRDGRIRVLVATDVAARGLDIDDISHVINFDLPQDPEIYVHRVGRTGRAGKTGVAITLVTPREMYQLRRIQNFIRQKIDQATVPSEIEIRQQREQQLLESVLVWLRRGRAKRERQMVDALVEQGYDPMEIAAVALKMARKDEKQRPIMPMSDVNAARTGREPRGRHARNGRYERRRGAKSRPNRGARTSHESGMVRLMIDMGREHGLRPNDVVGALAYHANIPGKTIGKILINDRHTLVDVRESVVGQVLAHAEPFRVGRRTFKVDVAA